MANRRMFSRRIIDSAKFLKMPISTQALYFHLNLNADDDGVVEAYKVIKMLGMGEDDLKVLVTKDFVRVLNEDLVTYILDWREHNLIRADRKINSIYQDLLVQIVPEAQLLESRERADVAKSKKNEMDESGRPMDDQRTAQVRLGKDRLDLNTGASPEFLKTIEKAKQQLADSKSMKTKQPRIKDYWQERANYYADKFELNTQERNRLFALYKQKGQAYMDAKCAFVAESRANHPMRYILWAIKQDNTRNK